MDKDEKKIETMADEGFNPKIGSFNPDKRMMYLNNIILEELLYRGDKEMAKALHKISNYNYSQEETKADIKNYYEKLMSDKRYSDAYTIAYWMDDFDGKRNAGKAYLDQSISKNDYEVFATCWDIVSNVNYSTNEFHKFYLKNSEMKDTHKEFFKELIPYINKKNSDMMKPENKLVKMMESIDKEWHDGYVKSYTKYKDEKTTEYDKKYSKSEEISLYDMHQMALERMETDFARDE